MAVEIINALHSLVKFVDRLGDFGGLVRIWDSIRNFAGKRGAGKAAEPAQAGTTTPTSAPPAEKPLEVDAFGQADERGLIVLLAKYGVSTKEASENVTSDENTAFSYLLSELSEGEGAALLRIIARGGVQEIKVTVTREVAAVNPEDPPQKVIRDYVVKIAIRGRSVIKGIAADILSAGDNIDERKNRAKQLVTDLRKLDVLNNIGDDFRKAWEGFKDGLPAELRSWETAKQVWETRKRIGWSTTLTIINGTHAKRLRANIRNATDEVEAAWAHREFREYLVRMAKKYMGLSPAEQQAVGMKPIRPWYKSLRKIMAYVVTPLLFTILFIVLYTNI